MTRAHRPTSKSLALVRSSKPKWLKRHADYRVFSICAGKQVTSLHSRPSKHELSAIEQKLFRITSQLAIRLRCHPPRHVFLTRRIIHVSHKNIFVLVRLQMEWTKRSRQIIFHQPASAIAGSGANLSLRLAKVTFSVLKS